MKLIGHAEAVERVLKFLRPQIKRQAFGCFAPEGVGRKLFSMSIFEALTGSPTSPDFKLLSSLGVEDIRDAQAWANVLPVQGKVKFLSIVPCEGLSLEAQQALLKLLEEPPSYLIIMLLGAPDRLSPAIYSRLVLIRLTHLIRSDCEAIWETLGIEPSTFASLRDLAPGQPGRALQRLTQTYPALLLSWNKFVGADPTAIGLLHWQDQLPKGWDIKEHKAFWLWLMPNMLKVYKDPTCPICTFAMEVADRLSESYEVAPRLLIPAIWHSCKEVK